MLSLYHNAIYEPLYNGLIFLIDILPWVSAGAAIILFTIIVKLILFPLSRASLKTQIKMKELEPEMNKIKEKNKDNTQAQSLALIQLYKEHNLNPFIGILLILIQIPIIIALYRIFLIGGLPDIHTEYLYSFINAPTNVDMNFFGTNIAEKSAVFAFLAALSQYFQVKFSIPAMQMPDGDKPSFKNDLARAMNIQMKYVLPVIVFFIAYSVNAAIAIYWITSNLFAIGQELFVRRKLMKESEVRLSEKKSV